MKSKQRKEEKDFEKRPSEMYKTVQEANKKPEIILRKIKQIEVKGQKFEVRKMKEIAKRFLTKF